MAAKELRDMWWKLLAATLAVVPALLIVVAYLPPYESAQRITERFSAEIAVQQVLSVYSGGGIALALLAVLLGGALVSAEVSRNTIFFLLSKPASRTRILMTKYAVCAGALLAAAALGHVVLFTIALIVKGYSLDLFSVWGVLLSTILLWLGSLFALGVATFFSVVFRSALVSLAATFAAFVTAYLAYGMDFLGLVPYRFNREVGWSLVSWSRESLYAGESLAATNFIVWLTLAALPILAALWLFGRKSY